VNKFLTKVPNRTRMITRLLQAAAGLMLLLAAITAVASRPPMRESATATPISTEHECTSVGQTAHTIAALDVEMDITERVRWTMVTPALDFFPVAVISTTPFTGDEVPLAV
jgi:hypothetical protein